MKGNQLSSAAKRRITQDWARSFSSLAVRQPMWLMKRHGPLIVGICLDRTRSNDVYIPTFHVHNLLRPWSTLILMLAHPLPDPKEPRLKREIAVDAHDESFEEAASLMHGQSPALDIEVLTLPRVLGLYEEHLRKRRDPAIARQPIRLFEDVVSLSCWAGQREYADKCLHDAAEAMRDWSFEGFDVPRWRARFESELTQDFLETTMSSQLEIHKLERIPSLSFVSERPDGANVVDAYLSVRAEK